MLRDQGGIEPVVRGHLAEHEAARDFGREVARVHHRYAAEVVAAFSLCPFLKDPASGFGRFCVMLDSVGGVESATEAAVTGEVGVVHLVFPLVDVDPGPFERFAMEVLQEVRRRVEAAPVMAVFHPRLSGDRTGPHRLVGLLRRAPDPFIQLVPEGLHEGGTVFAGALEDATEDHAEATFRRVSGPMLDQLLARLEAIRADRDASYAPLLARLAQPR